MKLKESFIPCKALKYSCTFNNVTSRILVVLHCIVEERRLIFIRMMLAEQEMLVRDHSDHNSQWSSQHLDWEHKCYRPGHRWAPQLRGQLRRVQLAAAAVLSRPGRCTRQHYTFSAVPLTTITLTLGILTQVHYHEGDREDAVEEGSISTVYWLYHNTLLISHTAAITIPATHRSVTVQCVTDNWMLTIAIVYWPGPGVGGGEATLATYQVVSRYLESYRDAGTRGPPSVRLSLHRRAAILSLEDSLG